MRVIVNSSLDAVIHLVDSRYDVVNLLSVSSVKSTTQKFAGTEDAYFIDISSMYKELSEVLKLVDIARMANLAVFAIYNKTDVLVNDEVCDALRELHRCGVRVFTTYEDFDNVDFLSLVESYPRNFSIGSLFDSKESVKESSHSTDIAQGFKKSASSILATFYSPLSVGVSSIVSSLAYMLASDLKVAVVDLSKTQSQYNMFGVTSDDSLTLLVNSNRDVPFVHSANLAIYANKPTINGPQIKLAGLHNIVSTLKKSYDVVLVDLSYYGEANVGTLQEVFNVSDTVYFVGDTRIESKELLPKHIIEITNSAYDVNLIITNILAESRYDQKEYVKHFKKVQMADYFVDCKLANIFEIASDGVAIVDSINSGAPPIVDKDCGFRQDISIIASAGFNVKVDTEVIAKKPKQGLIASFMKRGKE